MLAGRRVRVQLCGRMCVQGDDGVMIDSSAFPGRQGRIVFAYLVSTPQPVPREVLDGVLLAALEIVAEAAEPPAAVRAAQEACALRPLRETSHLQLIRAHLRAGNRAEAVGAYTRCRQLLAEELGVDPSPELQAVYLEALREPEVGQPIVRPSLPA